MINYEKLKLAHDLANEAARQKGFTFAVQVAIAYDHTVNYMLKAYLIDEQYHDIDDLINKLQELMQLNPKYAVNDIAYRVKHEDIRKAFCCGKEWNYVSTAWAIANCHLCGNNLQESCQHEININRHQEQFDINGCQHESSGVKIRGGVREAYEYHYKCTKCGEFYS